MNFRRGGSGDSGNAHNFYREVGSEKMFGKTSLSPLMSPRAHVIGQHDASPVAIVAIQGFFPFFSHVKKLWKKGENRAYRHYRHWQPSNGRFREVPYDPRQIF